MDAFLTMLNMFPEGTLFSVFVYFVKLGSITIFVVITSLSSLFFPEKNLDFSLLIDSVDPHFCNTISESPRNLRAECLGSSVC